MALEYAELFATDHLMIDDTTFDRLRDHFDEGQIVELTMAIARHLAFGRLTRVLELDQMCPLPGTGSEDDTKPVNFH
jgi:alkylhydroperoxidase family enzyme